MIGSDRPTGKVPSVLQSLMALLAVAAVAGLAVSHEALGDIGRENKTEVKTAIKGTVGRLLPTTSSGCAAGTTSPVSVSVPATGGDTTAASASSGGAPTSRDDDLKRWMGARFDTIDDGLAKARAEQAKTNTAVAELKLKVADVEQRQRQSEQDFDRKLADALRNQGEQSTHRLKVIEEERQREREAAKKERDKLLDDLKKANEQAAAEKEQAVRPKPPPPPLPQTPPAMVRAMKIVPTPVRVGYSTRLVNVTHEYLVPANSTWTDDVCRGCGKSVRVRLKPNTTDEAEVTPHG